MVTQTLNTMDQYGPNFQTKVISGLLTDKKFLIKTHDIISDEYFSNSGQKWVINQILEYYGKFNTIITMDVLKVELKKIDNEILKISIKEQLKAAYSNSNSEDLQYIEGEFSNFCRNQQVKKSLLKSVDLLHAGDFDSIKILMGNALKAGTSEDIGHQYDKDIESRYREDNRCPIPYPWKTLNKITQGGYGKGDLILIFGNPKGGKSWALVAMAAEAARLGKNIVYYSLELSEEYVGKRFDAYFTGIPVDEIDQHRDKVEEVMKSIPGKIVIKGYSPKRASLDTIENHVKQLEDQEEFKAEALYIDYLDLLKNRTTRKEVKDDIDDVYTDAKGLARELMIPIASPSQANRAGADKEILESIHIGGSYQKLMIGDTVISIARGRKDRIDGTGRFHLMGNRYGVDGVTYFAKIDTRTGHIEVDEDEYDIDDDYDSKPSSPYGGVNKNEKKHLNEEFSKLKNSLK